MSAEVLDTQIRKKLLEDSYLHFFRYFFKQEFGHRAVISPAHEILFSTLVRTKLPVGHPDYISRLVINIPPGFGKSLSAVIYYVAHGLAINPGARFLHLSSSAPLVLMNSASVRKILRSKSFRSMWRVNVLADVDSKAIWHTDRVGGMVSMSADGQVIGQRAGHLYHPESDVSTGAILIDDPLKAADERYANRVNIVNENYPTTIASRLAHESVPIILIMQRLHYNDMSSFLLNGGSGEYWHHLSLPVEIPVEPPQYKFSHGIPIPHNLPPGPLWRQKFDETAITALKTQRRRYRTQYMQAPPRVDEDDVLWTEDLIARARSIRMPECTRTVVAVDPAASNNEHSDLNGIIVAGRAGKNQFTVFEDFSLKSSPKRWAKRAMLAYEKYSAIGIVVEVNMGGDMVADTLRNAGFRGRIIEVRASKGKVIRADPISALYEMRYVSHAGGLGEGGLGEEGLGELEDEMLSFSSLTGLSDGVSPNRLDALVWALTYLAGGGVALSKLLESAINQNSTYNMAALG